MDRQIPQSAIRREHSVGLVVALEKAFYRLIVLAALVSLLFGILCLMESATPRTAGIGQMRLADGGEPNQAEVSLGQALQALSVRH
jgi:hypothetical protein